MACSVHESVPFYSNLTFMSFLVSTLFRRLSTQVNRYLFSTSRVALYYNQNLNIKTHQMFIAETYHKQLEGIKDEL